MKKIVYTLLLSLTLSSCSNDKDIVLEDYDSNKKDLVNEKRSYGEIINIARSVISVEVDKSTRGEVCGSVSIYPLIGNNTRTESDTLLYAVDFDDSEGFAIISAYKSITPVLAVIEQGSFASEETTSNSGFQYALEKAINYASDTKNANMLPELPKPLIPTKWYEYSDTIFPRRKINPRIKINLNQKWPENQLCPNLLAGCAPIAAFQIMAGLRQPLHLEYTYPGHTLEYEAIDWNNLNKHTFSLDTKFPTQLEINNHLNNCGLNESEHLVLSRIAREIGHRANADYSSPMITSTGYEIIDALERTIGKSKSKSGSDANTLFEDLYKKNKSVALLMAFGKYENSSTIAGGHVWVADGVWEIGMIVHFYAYLAPVIGNDDQELVCVTDDTLKKYIHFNWGWGGDCNGYFLVDIFNANNAYQYDNSSMTNTCDDISWNESFEYLLYEP